jgi:hypothetical protein
MATKKADPTQPAVVEVQGLDGSTHYAWRKDGRKPVIDEEAFAANIHMAIDPKSELPADFADRVGPRP